MGDEWNLLVPTRPSRYTSPQSDQLWIPHHDMSNLSEIVNFVRISVFFVHTIHKQKEYRLSFAQLSSWCQSWIDGGCKLIAHPTWYMYWKKLLWIITLSCNEWSLRLHLECSLESSQMFLFLPSLADVLFHFPQSIIKIAQNGSDRHTKSVASNVHASSSKWSSGISVSLLVQITCLLDPWEILTKDWELSWPTDKIRILIPCLPCKSLVVTSSTGPNLVFSWIHPFGCDVVSSLGWVHSRQATVLNCVKSPVSFVLRYYPTSTTLRNPASIQKLLNLSCCERLSIRFSHCWNRKVWCAG